jgi:HD-GYP domain-containing protein (c-di-GMP phosphodiesterase class II)
MIEKNGSLDKNEWAEMKKHPLKGATMVSSLKLPAEVIAGIKYHHERIDGKGYPEGMKGEKIPLFARIIAIADSYDAITAGRPYKAALSKSNALLELKNNAGSQFDEKLVEILIGTLSKK